jgi:hypothetical protein
MEPSNYSPLSSVISVSTDLSAAGFVSQSFMHPMPKAGPIQRETPEHSADHQQQLKPGSF